MKHYFTWIAVGASMALGMVVSALFPFDAPRTQAEDPRGVATAAFAAETPPAPPAGPVTAPPAAPAATAPAAAPADGPLTPTENPTIKPGDWPMWGGTSLRNNTPDASGIAVEWKPGKFDRKTGAWLKETAQNIRWTVQLGSQTYGNPVVADGKVFVGTNNGAGYLKRYPKTIDLGCLLCFDEKTGAFLWQHSSEKLPTGRVHDWPLMGICCAPMVEGKRLWFVTSRGEVVCADTEGFRDGENNGPFKGEPNDNQDEADVIWKVDMMKELGVSQHNMCSCSVCAWGDILFVNTSNGVDESHINIPAPNAPSFIAMNKHTGKIYWTDSSPGVNIHHGQWSSPTVGILGGVAQAIFGGGDGWVYSFKADAGKDGKPELLWKFDANPKDSVLILGGRGTRNDVIGTPVIHDGKVYVGTGQDPEHAEGVGILWCIDPTKRGDVSPELAVLADDHTKILPYDRIQAVQKEKGQVAIPNPNSAVIWKFYNQDRNGDGKIDFEEQMHRTCGTVAIKDGLLFVADFSGIFHCLDAKTGKVHWTYDMLAAAWGSPLIVGDHVYIGDEDGDVAVFKVAAEPQEPVSEINMLTAVYSTPIVANGTLWISNKDHLFAIEVDAMK